MGERQQVSQSISLVPVQEKDESFLFEVYCNVAPSRFAHVGLSDNTKAQLLLSQFEAQLSQYRSNFPDANFDLVLEDDQPIGSFYTQRGPERYVLIDIALLPSRRGSGIGASLVRSLLTEARLRNQAVDAHVLKVNPAWRLWQRLGFRILEDDGVYLKIQARPES